MANDDDFKSFFAIVQLLGRISQNADLITKCLVVQGLDANERIAPQMRKNVVGGAWTQLQADVRKLAEGPFSKIKPAEVPTPDAN